ncbi:MAG: hypothetical protein U0002_14150 [Thermoanaerobaculia bacterium]
MPELQPPAGHLLHDAAYLAFELQPGPGALQQRHLALPGEGPGKQRRHRRRGLLQAQLAQLGLALAHHPEGEVAERLASQDIRHPQLGPLLAARAHQPTHHGLVHLGAAFGEAALVVPVHHAQAGEHHRVRGQLAHGRAGGEGLLQRLPVAGRGGPAGGGSFLVQRRHPLAHEGADLSLLEGGHAGHGEAFAGEGLRVQRAGGEEHGPAPALGGVPHDGEHPLPQGPGLHFVQPVE